MKNRTTISIICMSVMLLLSSGCATLTKGAKTLDHLAYMLSLSAGTTTDTAKDGRKVLESKLLLRGKVEVRYKGLWLDGDILRADMVEYTGISINYTAEPFAWSVTPRNSESPFSYK